MTSTDELVLSQREWQSLSDKLRTAMAMGCKKSNVRTWWSRSTEAHDGNADEQAKADPGLDALRAFLCQSRNGSVEARALQESGFTPAQIDAATFLSQTISGR